MRRKPLNEMYRSQRIRSTRNTGALTVERIKENCPSLFLKSGRPRYRYGGEPEKKEKEDYESGDEVVVEKTESENDYLSSPTA
jgi:hypothetical protein